MCHHIMAYILPLPYITSLMADEKGSTSDSEAAPVARRLTKLLSMPCSSSISILENLNIRSNQRSSPPAVPPPVLLPQRSSPQNQITKFQGHTLPATSISPPTPNSDLHPIIEITREQELGKLVINIAVPVAIALLLTSNGNSQELLVVHIIVFGLMIGCMAIWNGILFRKTFSGLANILEQFGISLVLLFLYGLVASFLPKAFFWACWLCGAFCLIPFIYARIKRQTEDV